MALTARPTGPPAAPGGEPSPTEPPVGAVRLARATIALLCVSFPLHQLVVLPGVGPVTNLTSAVALALAVVALSRGFRSRPPMTLLGLMVAYITWAVLSFFWSVDPDVTLVRIRTYLSILAVVVALALLLRGVAERRVAFQSFVVGTAVLSLNVLYNFASGQSANVSVVHQRFSAGLSNPNRLGAMVLIGAVMAWHLLRTQPRGGWALLNRGVLLATPLVILLTASRSAFLASLPVAAVVLATSLRTSLRGRLGTAALIVVAAGLAVSVVPDTTIVRIQSLYGAADVGSGSVARRQSALEVGLDRYWDRPVVGHGAGTYPGVVQDAADTRIVAHNSYVSVLVELGAAGLVLFLAVPLAVAARLRRCRTGEQLLGYVLLGSWGMVAIFASLEDDKMTWLVFVLLATLGMRDRGDDPPVHEGPALTGADGPSSRPRTW